MPDGPKRTIQAAINASSSGDTVVVASGTYLGTGNRAIRFGGRLITVMSQAGPATCIIDCEISSRAFHFDSSETADAVLEGFTIRNGRYVRNVAGAAMGGAILCEQSSPTIRACVFESNSARKGTAGDAFGGAVACVESAAIIEHCEFRDNRVIAGFSGIAAGGALSAVGLVSPRIIDSVFETNSAADRGAAVNVANNAVFERCEFRDHDAASLGGAVRVVESDAEFVDCIFEANYADSEGGAVFCEGGSPRFVNCDFSANACGGRGGAVYGDSVQMPMFTECHFEDNESDTGGAMIFVSGVSPSICRSMFIRNEALSGSGGAIWMGETEITIEGSDFENNRASTDGGAIYMGQGDVGDIAVVSCRFADNQAAGHGGAIQSRWARRVTIDESVFENNAAQYGGGLDLGATGFVFSASGSIFRGNHAARSGGGVSLGRGTRTMTLCIFENNTAASQDGGGVRLVQGTALFAGCLFSRNSANSGGGAHAGNNEVSRFVNCTFVENMAASGGGVHSEATTVLDNCILWGNSLGQLTGNVSPVTYSTVQGGYFGTGVIDHDPRFVDPNDGDYRLLHDSPCIDAASNLALPSDTCDVDNDGDVEEALPIDLDRLDRFVDDPGTSDTGVSGNGHDQIVDMGAYEYRSVCFADCNGDAVVNTLDVICFLNLWVVQDASADCDGNELINTQDLLCFLNSWTQGC